MSYFSRIIFGSKYLLKLIGIVNLERNKTSKSNHKWSKNSIIYRTFFHQILGQNLNTVCFSLYFILKQETTLNKSLNNDSSKSLKAWCMMTIKRCTKRLLNRMLWACFDQVNTPRVIPRFVMLLRIT